MKVVPASRREPEEAGPHDEHRARGAFLVSQAVARHMIKQKSGAIVNIASIAGLFPYNWAAPTRGERPGC